MSNFIIETIFGALIAGLAIFIFVIWMISCNSVITTVIGCIAITAIVFAAIFALIDGIKDYKLENK